MMRVLEWAILAGVLFACILSVWLTVTLSRGDAIGVETHWGGLGGGTSGWRASESLIALLAALFAWLMVVALVIVDATAGRTDKETKDHDARAAGTASASASASASVRPASSVEPAPVKPQPAPSASAH